MEALAVPLTVLNYTMVRLVDSGGVGYGQTFSKYTLVLLLLGAIFLQSSWPSFLSGYEISRLSRLTLWARRSSETKIWSMEYLL